MTGTRAEEPLLDVRSIVKTYGQVEALRGVDLDARAGEVVALVGDNGAGKSTLIKVLSGVIQPDSGEIRIDGRPVTLSTPAAAAEHGIGVVYQDLALAPELDVVDNFFLGREILKPGILGRLGFLDRRAMLPVAQETFNDYGLDLIRPREPVSTLSGGQKQSVAVVRSVAERNAIVFMDEPTAALGVVQTQKVLDVIRRVRERGSAVILITHDLPHALEVADRVQVLRLGRRVASYEAAETSLEQLIDTISGVDPRDGGR